MLNSLSLCLSIVVCVFLSLRVCVVIYDPGGLLATGSSPYDCKDKRFKSFQTKAKQSLLFAKQG